jgi:drug/metabolite transporter (DMT)-like permease
MQVVLLYAAVVLIWGSTWAAIPYQLGVVAAEVSVGYRFGIAALGLYLYAVVSRRRLRLPANTYPMVFLQGTLLFSINYFFVYYGTAYITSGLVAVLFSSIILMNTVFERLFFKTPFDGRLLLAAAVGIAGIAMIFWPEISALGIADETVRGIILVIIATAIASLGNMTAVINTRRDLPVVAVNAHGMAFAALLALAIAAALGREFDFLITPGYVLSLLYLAILGSAVAFGCYLALIRRIGSTRAAYSSVLFPVVALTMSTLIEDYRWTPIAATGIVFTLVGNWLILSRRKMSSDKEGSTNER